MFGLMGDENENLLTGIARVAAAATREGRRRAKVLRGFTGSCVLACVWS